MKNQIGTFKIASKSKPNLYEGKLFIMPAGFRSIASSVSGIFLNLSGGKEIPTFASRNNQLLCLTVKKMKRS